MAEPSLNAPPNFQWSTGLLRGSPVRQKELSGTRQEEPAPGLQRTQGPLRQEAGPRPLEARAAGLAGQLWHTDSERTASSHPLRKLQIVHAIHHRPQPTAPTRFPTVPPTPNPVPPIRVSVSRSLLEKWRRESCPIDRSECALTAHARRARSRAPSNLLLTSQPALLAILLTGTSRALIHRLGADHLRDNPEPKGLLCDRQTPDPGEHGERQNGHRSDRQLAHHFRALTAQCACAPATHGPSFPSSRSR